MRRIHHAGRYSGFSLVEVMVALLVISIGLLGIAKMQALSLSTTSQARLRSLAALEASSLASMMRADRVYWASAATTAKSLSIVIQGASISSTTDTAITGTADCTFATGILCTAPADLAGYDLITWAKSVNAVVPNEYATISCQQPAPVAPVPALPVTCSISIAWAETNGPASLATPQYTVVVQP